MADGITDNTEQEDIGPPIRMLSDSNSSCSSALSLFEEDVASLFDDASETDFSDMQTLEVEVDIEPSYVKDSGSIPEGPPSLSLQIPEITFSTFKPTPRHPDSPDYVSLSPTSMSSAASSLLAIWPTRKSFVERWSSTTNNDFLNEYSSSDCSSESDPFVDSDTPNGSEEEIYDDVVNLEMSTTSENCSQSTLVNSVSGSCVSPAEQGDDSRMSGFNSTSVTPVPQSEDPPQRSKYARRHLSESCQVTRSTPDILEEDSFPSIKRYSQCYPASEESFTSVRERLESCLKLNSADPAYRWSTPQPIPCNFPTYQKDPLGRNALPKSNCLTDNHTIHHSFVFSNTPSSVKKTPPSSDHQSNIRYRQSTPKEKGKRPQSAFVGTTMPDSSKSKSSKRFSLSYISSFFQNAWKRRSSVPAERVAARNVASPKQSPPTDPIPGVGKSLTLEMKSKYSDITNRRWESDSMVMLPPV